MYEHEKIDYVEMPAKDFEGTKAFFGKVFGWSLQDAGPDYLAFTDQGVDGGFFRSDQKMSSEAGSALVIFYSVDIESTQEKIKAANGTISKPTMYFPGGRRFHFLDPNGNEFAVWSDHEANGTLVG
ncbi:MAG: VOC family protein [Gammaproteobacteria bacterium]|nr:VOC family protein [Gammaproteobacteria bacterium]